MGLAKKHTLCIVQCTPSKHQWKCLSDFINVSYRSFIWVFPKWICLKFNSIFYLIAFCWSDLSSRLLSSSILSFDKIKVLEWSYQLQIFFGCGKFMERSAQHPLKGIQIVLISFLVKDSLLFPSPAGKKWTRKSVVISWQKKSYWSMTICMRCMNS